MCLTTTVRVLINIITGFIIGISIPILLPKAQGPEARRSEPAFKLKVCCRRRKHADIWIAGHISRSAQRRTATGPGPPRAHCHGPAGLKFGWKWSSASRASPELGQSPCPNPVQRAHAVPAIANNSKWQSNHYACKVKKIYL